MIFAENILICIAVPMLIVIFFLRDNPRALVISFILGMILSLTSAYVGGFAAMVSDMSPEDVSVFISPVIEEAFKFLPLIMYLLMIEPADERLFVTGLGIGSGFATFENCCYILNYGAESFTYILIRGMAVGVMHIVSVIALTLGLILARRLDVLKLPGILGAISLSMLFHGLYNLLVSQPGVSSVIGYVLPVATAVIMYILYSRVKDGGSVVMPDRQM